MRKSPLGILLSVLLLAALAPWRVCGDISLPPVLSSHMVLQREMPAPVWGTAAPGEKISVKFRDQEKHTTADAAGKWMVKLDALKAGGPDVMTIIGSNVLTLEDVLVGEVWLGSGQSNMETYMNFYKDDQLDKVVAAGPYPRLRVIKSDAKTKNPVWLTATNEAIPVFPAQAFVFGVQLQKELDVPVGLVIGAIGGTPAAPWIPADAYAHDSEFRKEVDRLAASSYYTNAVKKYEQDKAKYDVAAEELKKQGKNPGWPPPFPLKPGEANSPKEISYLYAQHIEPFVPYAVRGVLWDQGESGTALGGINHYVAMGVLIRGWRHAWGRDDLPFLVVQKPSGGGSALNPADPVTCRSYGWHPQPATLPDAADMAAGLEREIYQRIREYPHTFLITSMDIGAGLHPYKYGYGVRDARVALSAVYGREAEIYGPIYKSAKVEGNKIRLSLTHIGPGLVISHGDKLQGFLIAGADQAFQWGVAVIDGDTVVVSSDKVPEPVAVRYAWRSDFPWANLFSKNGLPTLTFRTDTW